MTLGESYSIILAVLAAATAGLVGAFALMKRMTLAGDAVSHVALPGIGVALLLNLNPILGATVALLIGAVLIWNLEQRTGLATETTIGVIFSASLALGALITPSEELVGALFGNFEALRSAEFFLYASVALLVIGFMLQYKNQLVLGLFAPDLAQATKVNIPRLNLLYLVVFAMTIILGLRFLGALLMGALIIIPAAAARQLTHHLGQFLVASSCISILAVLLGFFFADTYHIALGPTVVTVAAVIFALSLFKTKK